MTLTLTSSNYFGIYFPGVIFNFPVSYLILGTLRQLHLRSLMFSELIARKLHLHFLQDTKEYLNQKGT